jgi:hypothetical protein
MARYEQLTVGAINRTGCKVLAAAYTIPETHDGMCYFLNLAAGFAVTLPKPKLGKRLKFVVKLANTGAYTIVTNGGDNVIQGLQNVANTLVPGSNEDTITFAATNTDVGDWVELESDIIVDN